MKVTIDTGQAGRGGHATGGLLYEYVEPEGWVGELTTYDRKLLKMTLEHVMKTLLTSPMRETPPGPPSPPKGRLQ